jgi:hypothetical protein
MTFMRRFASPEPAMRFRISDEVPAGFVLMPADQFAMAPFPIDWRRTEELYRDALEKAREVLRPSIVDRLAPYWN